MADGPTELDVVVDRCTEFLIDRLSREDFIEACDLIDDVLIALDPRSRRRGLVQRC